MKKVLTGFVVLLFIISVSYMLVKNESNKSASVNTEKLEDILVKSMEETKTEKKKLEQFLTIGSQELNNNGYQVNLGFSHEERNLTVQVPDKAFLKANQMDIEKIIYNTAKTIGFQDFKVDFLTLENLPLPTLSEEDEKSRNSMMKVVEEIRALLKEKGYPSNSVLTNPNNEFIIEIQGTKEDLEYSKEIEELEKIFGQMIQSKTDFDYTVKIRKKKRKCNT
ncbi:hypothetical protein ACTHOQ_12225 [Solibacillus silvestris]|uniref:hypothetical protein n=1 Tax=Solibacillus silvestris TaxID=76853 RepID=UPI003F8000AF